MGAHTSHCWYFIAKETGPEKLITGTWSTFEMLYEDKIQDQMSKSFDNHRARLVWEVNTGNKSRADLQVLSAVDSKDPIPLQRKTVIDTEFLILMAPTAPLRQPSEKVQNDNSLKKQHSESVYSFQEPKGIGLRPWGIRIVKNYKVFIGFPGVLQL